MSSQKQVGIVKWFRDDFGYGFIEMDCKTEVFVHHSKINGTGRRTLLNGQIVEFDLGHGEKGPQAYQVEALQQNR